MIPINSFRKSGWSEVLKEGKSFWVEALYSYVKCFVSVSAGHQRAGRRAAKMARYHAGARKLETRQCAFRFALVVLLLGTLLFDAFPAPRRVGIRRG